jgi:peptidoglycan/xylan/chitin deacetylase (PgdA/CDA1 family)
VKRILNYFSGTQQRERVLSLLMESLSLGSVGWGEKFYLTEANLRTMQAGGMLIGAHTMTHPVMSTLSATEQRVEIVGGFERIASAVGEQTSKTFCHPFGGFHSFDAQTEAILAAERCDFAFNVEPRDVAAADLLMRPYAIPRYDCNRFPFGSVRVRNHRSPNLSPQWGLQSDSLEA